MKTYIGIDNGVSGSIGIIHPGGSVFYPTPTTKAQDYIKTKRLRTRINVNALADIIKPFQHDQTLVLIERPMVNPKRFDASTSALRALEATLIVIEQLNFAHQYIDSKEWQKVMLPKGIKGAPVLKAASLDIGKRLFPQHTFTTDADGILIAEWARRMNL